MKIKYIGAFVCRLLLGFKDKKKDYMNILGRKFLVTKDMSWCFADGDYYEKNVIYWLDKLFDKLDKPVFYDIGANIGYYSIRYCDFADRIYSFEPVKTTFDLLVENIRLNNLKNVGVFNLGISDQSGKRQINLYSSSGNNSLFSRSIPNDIDLKKIGDQEVELKILDDLVFNSKILPPGIMKIDVEGSELFVLKGAEKTISKFKPVLLIEYSKATSDDAGYSRENILQQLNTEDYIIYGLSESDTDLGLIEFKDFKINPPANILAIPKLSGIQLGKG